MSNFTFQKANRKAVPVKLALQGVSFSGKTMSSIKLARGLAGDKPVFVIDTENESAAMYDHLGFMHGVIAPPFKPDEYINAIRMAVEMGAGAIVIDSLTHAWQYILDYKDMLDQNKGKSDWSHWSKAKPLWKSLKDAVLQCPVHVVVTLREKAEYQVDQHTDSSGNRTSRVNKIGTKAQAEDGFEYEFNTVWKLSRDNHTATVEKDRTGLFDGRMFIIDEGIGREIVAWLGAASDFESGAEWDLIKNGMSREFQEASDDSEKFRRDRAKLVLNALRVKADVTARFIEVLKDSKFDFVSLVLDADQYGATDASRLIYYVCQKAGLDVVEFERIQNKQDGKITAGPGTADRYQSASTQTRQTKEDTVPAAQEEVAAAETKPVEEPEPEQKAEPEPEVVATIEGGTAHEPEPEPEPIATDDTSDRLTEAAKRIFGESEQPATETTIKPEAFGYTLTKVIDDSSFEKELTDGQKRLMSAKLEHRKVPQELWGQFVKVVCAGYGIAHGTMAAGVVVNDFLSDANEESFDLVMAQIDGEGSNLAQPGDQEGQQTLV